jgi:hypothetical protein
VVDETVPMDSYRNGEVSYINTANAIETLSPAQVVALDPLGRKSYGPEWLVVTATII